MIETKNLKSELSPLASIDLSDSRAEQEREAENADLCDICEKPMTSTEQGEKIFFAIFGAHRECADIDFSFES